jgi:hypothetical protein
LRQDHDHIAQNLTVLAVQLNAREASFGETDSDIAAYRGLKTVRRQSKSAWRRSTYRPLPLKSWERCTVSFYLRNDTAFIPTMAKTEAGYWMGIEPVDV